MSKQKFIIDILKIADINTKEIPTTMFIKMEGRETYQDKVLKEHLFSSSELLEQQSIELIFTRPEMDILEAIQAEMNKKGCAYFRLINP